MNAEITDTDDVKPGSEGRSADGHVRVPLVPLGHPQAQVFYDAHCELCSKLLARWGDVLRRRGFEFVPLDAPWVSEALKVPLEVLLQAMHLRRADGLVVAGVDAWREMFRAVWWLWPVGIALGLPGIKHLARRGYAWLAANRHCLGGTCGLKNRAADHHPHRATTFLELP